MKELSTYLINSLKSKQQNYKDSIVNKTYYIDLNNFFRETDKIEIKGKFVSACKFPMPIPERQIIKNDMTKYKLINRYDRNKKKAELLRG
jgi:hypothetical protein|tara:strand:- start:4417 stop:4686 length:270 start_codon:yes stop_codon:yes gene_type:complete